MDALYGFSHYWIRVCYNLFFQGEVSGTQFLPASGPFIIASNHASHLDPPFVGCQTFHQLTFVARKSLWNSPPARWWLDGVGTIPLDRDAGSDLGAMRRIIGALQSGKIIILFPEGTRSPDGNLQPAKPGVGMIACRTGVPVVPARIFGSFQALGKGRRLRLNCPVSVAFGPSLSPAEYDQPDRGKERYQIASERIIKAIERLTKPERPVN